jgi:dolichol-phosphate mannosyltransferase
MLSIILPTYNERNNVSHILRRIDTELAELTRDYQIIIVDDDSPDRTWAVADELVDQYPLKVIRRTEASGLATAVLSGFEASAGDIVCVLDADLQHPPERIPDLLECFTDSSVDLVIGSRLVDGGSFGGFSVFRRIETLGANGLAYLLFPEVWGVRDLQSGFFACRREVVENVDLRPIGYKILLEILVLGNQETVREVGYEFRERRVGDSNLDWRIVLKYVVHLLSLRYRSLLR